MFHFFPTNPFFLNLWNKGIVENRLSVVVWLLFISWLHLYTYTIWTIHLLFYRQRKKLVGGENFQVNMHLMITSGNRVYYITNENKLIYRPDFLKLWQKLSIQCPLWLISDHTRHPWTCHTCSRPDPPPLDPQTPVWDTWTRSYCSKCNPDSSPRATQPPWHPMSALKYRSGLNTDPVSV